MPIVNNMKIYCVGNHSSIANWMRGHHCGSMEKADVVVFPGGADVNPSIYDELPHPRTHFDDKLDAMETVEFNKAVMLNKPLVGICRGAQFLCAKAGGKLVQHQANFGKHDIMTYDGKIIKVSSDHHQAMYPWGMKNFQVLAWSLGDSLYHEDSNQQEMVIGKVPMDMEVEIAFFPGINALGIQAHPEWQYPQRVVSTGDKQAIDYFRLLMDRFMSGDQFTESSKSYAIVA